MTAYDITVACPGRLIFRSLSFSLIIFNIDDVESSKKYLIVYKKFAIDGANGGSYSYPPEFTDNLIIGLT
jgi:hypothetical protein